jgi:hypothetical protein
MASREPHGLFRWSNGRVVLFVERDGAGWVVARGWQEGDSLVDVRRWRFDDARRVVGQIRRLVRDATADPALADAEAERVQSWLNR